MKRINYKNYSKINELKNRMKKEGLKMTKNQMKLALNSCNKVLYNKNNYKEYEIVYISA